MAAQIFVFEILFLFVAFALCVAMGLSVARRQRTFSLALLASVAVVACCFGVVPAFAAEGSPDSDVDAATTATEESVQFMLGNDLVWFGDRLDLENETTSNDILSAAQRITIVGSEVKGSVRAAAEDISISDTAVAQSVTLAGEDIRFENASAAGIALAGKDIVFSGETGDAYLAAQDVSIDGVIHGDVYVYAETLTLGDNAVVEGMLYAELGQEPALAAGAQVNDMEVTLSETNSADTADVLAGLGAAFTVANVVLGILGAFIMTLLAEWLLRRQTLQSALMCKGRTAPMLVSGFVGALAAPILLVMLLLTVIGIPLAGALLLLLLALQILAVGFAAASLAKVAFPDMGRYKAAMLMGALAGVASAIPMVGGLVSIAAFMYVLGYILQCIFLGMRKEAAPYQQPPVPGQPAGPSQPQQMPPVPPEAFQG